MDRYEKFFEETFVNEGSFQMNPKDKGNWHNEELYGTIYGITARDHFSSFMTTYLLYNKGLLKEAKGYAREFYYSQGYWNPLYDKIESEALAFKLFDFGVNAGVKKAVQLLQEVLMSFRVNLEPDGVFGSITLEAVNKVPAEGLYNAYIARLEKYYKSLKMFSVFGKGWLSRLMRKFSG